MLILLIGLGTGVYLVQKSGFQIFQSKAYDVPVSDILRNINSEKGFQIDPGTDKIPSREVYNTLIPKWVRFVYFPDKGIPSNIPATVGKLVVFNNESTDESPLGKIDLSLWKNYIDNVYIPDLETFLKQYSSKVNAIEVWNEEDVCPGKKFCPGVPSRSYAYMLKEAAAKIKSYNANINVVMGGLNSGDLGYIQTMQRVEPNVFNQVDAVAVHPYGTSPAGWCEDGKDADCNGIVLPFGDLADVVNMYKSETGKPIWVTEVGFGTEDEVWQARYLDKTFAELSKLNVPVVIWYSWSDRMKGGIDEPNWGLVNERDIIKASGVQFQLYNRI